jgi:hypothetical protein
MHSFNPKTVEEFVGRYPRVLAKISLAAQLPCLEHAAVILRDAVERRRNYSEWVLTQYGGDALKAVRSTLKLHASFRTLRPARSLRQF